MIYLAPIIIVGLRLIAPFYILKNPLKGTILCLVLDALDVILVNFLGYLPFLPKSEIPNYHQVDKILDIYYLSFSFYSSLKTWKYKPAVNISKFLFVWRCIGFISFEATKMRIFLFIFPNLFENFFLFFEIFKKYKKPETLTYKRLFVWVLILLALKMPQEFILHFKEFSVLSWLNEDVFKWNL